MGCTCLRILGCPKTYDWKRLDSGFASVRTNSVPTLNTSAAMAADVRAAALLKSGCALSHWQAVAQSGRPLPDSARRWRSEHSARRHSGCKSPAARVAASLGVVSQHVAR